MKSKIIHIDRHRDFGGTGFLRANQVTPSSSVLSFIVFKISNNNIREPNRTENFFLKFHLFFLIGKHVGHRHYKCTNSLGYTLHNCTATPHIYILRVLATSYIYIYIQQLEGINLPCFFFHIYIHTHTHAIIISRYYK